MKIRVVDVNVNPVCPHCERKLDRIGRIPKGFMENTVVFVCPFEDCNKILSISYSLGW